MPIKPENRHHYVGSAWKEARAAVLARAGDACECAGECSSKHGAAPGSRCGAPNGKSIMRSRRAPEQFTVGCFEHRGTDALPPVKVVLTIAHLDHNPGCNDLDRLRAFCQRCHLRYDRHQHGKSAAETRRRKRTQGQVALPIGGGR